MKNEAARLMSTDVVWEYPDTVSNIFQAKKRVPFDMIAKLFWDRAVEDAMI